MKKLIIGVLVSLLIIATLLFWPRSKPSRDEAIRKNLPGTWVVDWGHGVSSTSVIGTDDSYVCQITGFTNGMAVKLEGVIQVKDGFLVDTTKKSSQTNAHVPYVGRERIIRAGAHEMVVSLIGGNGESVMRKVTR
jgi:hypothetical protein